MRELVKKGMINIPMLPGVLEQHYNTCGKRGCRCLNKENPQKHGPYYRLSYMVKGKNSSISVNKSDAYLVREMTEAYKEYRNLPIELGLEMIELCKKEGVSVAVDKYKSIMSEIEKETGHCKSESIKLKEVINSKEKWKEKAIERRKEINSKNKKVKELEKSRKDWKSKYLSEKADKKEVEKELLLRSKQLKDEENIISEQDKKKLLKMN